MSEPWNELLKYLETGDKSEYSKLFGGMIKLISLGEREKSQVL